VAMAPTDPLPMTSRVARFWHRRWRRILLLTILSWLGLVVISGLLALWSGRQMVSSAREARDILETGSAEISDHVDALSRWSTVFSWSVEHPGLDLLRLVAPLRQLVNVARETADLSRRGADLMEGDLPELIAEVYSGNLLNDDNSIDMRSAEFLAPQTGPIAKAIWAMTEPAKRLHTQVSSSSLLHRWSLDTADLVRSIELAADGVDALSRLPDLAGAGDKAHYFVALTTPAELRGLQGLVGNYALISLDRGVIEVEEVGSNADLKDPPRLSTGISPGYGELFGRTNTEWLNMNLSPFGNDAAVQIIDAWALMDKPDLDGVIFLDTVALGQILSDSVEGLTTANGVPLSTGAELTEYLSRGVYFDFPIDQDGRKTFQTEFAEQLLSRFLSNPISFKSHGNRVASLVRGGHFTFWEADRPERQSTIRSVLARSTTSLSSEGVLVAFNNIAGNKADTYLSGAVTSSRAQARGPSTYQTEFEILLRSDLPRDDQLLPDYVARRLDNLAQDQPGPASVLTLEMAFGSSAVPSEISVDDQSLVPTVKMLDQGVSILRHTIVIPAGESRRIRLSVQARGEAPRLELAPMFRNWTQS
jgi:hypothetical protein